MVDFANNSYGKVEKEMAPRSIYMEYDHIFTHFATYLPNGWDELPTIQCIKDGISDRCSFREWLRNNG